MAKYIATLLFIDADSNPEEAVVPIEAAGADDALEQASAIFQRAEHDLRGLRRRSYADPELWGKVQRTVIAVDTAEEYEARAGWAQDEHHAFLRERAKA